MDPLDALVSELERIEGHESTLQDALANNKAVVVHPRPEVWVPVPAVPETPMQQLTSMRLEKLS